MKTAKEINVDNRVRTVMECSVCGATTHVKAGINTKTAQAPLGRPCGACNPVRNPLVNQGWWLEFGLDRNPYVYEPMPRLRTSTRIALKRQDGGDGWLGPGMMNTRSNGKGVHYLSRKLEVFGRKCLTGIDSA